MESLFLNKNDNDVKFTDININSHKYKFVEVEKGEYLQTMWKMLQ